MKRDKRFIQSIIEGKSEEEKIEILSQEIAKIIFEESSGTSLVASRGHESIETDSEVEDLFAMLNFSPE